ncbi:conserved hypothetical protein [Shewanella sediminis HAW-EB3]|uniref:DUF3261 domain-containing protein n=1 Tax=Shewanella sediminis (strain HAW-EB3) TaxID=425104 RepID=A8FQ04_SHESH|nr:DUF3261 domain-containing protein [Shewanella sediminis]ABV34927.1 conserved hypothetical protein [Shewanella sediminis HAW-EB3]
MVQFHNTIPDRLKRGKGICVLICLTMLVSACSQTLQRQTCVALAKGVSYCLAPIPSDNKARSATQQVAINVNDSRHELLSHLELDREKLTLVGLAPLGQALFTLVFDGASLNSQQSMLLGDEFKAEYLLALIQLIYWPLEDVNAHLQGATLTSPECDAPRCRRIYATGNDTKADQQESILKIRFDKREPWKAEVELAIPQANFELKITPV